MRKIEIKQTVRGKWSDVPKFKVCINKFQVWEFLKFKIFYLFFSSSIFLSISLLESGSNILYRWLIHDITNTTRVKILNIVTYLLQHPSIGDTGRKKLLLKGGLMDGVGELLCKQDIDRDVVVHVLKLSLSVDRSSDLKTDIYTDFCIVLTVFRMVQYQARPVKLEVAIKVRFIFQDHLLCNCYDLR